MFSYRHGFHAGAHSDVLKHSVLIGVLKHLTQKEAALTVIDTHAGAGLYRLDGDFAATSGESKNGIAKFFSPASGQVSETKSAIKSDLLRDYLNLISSFNEKEQIVIYPGSPFVIQKFLRIEARDKLRLFELHPSDYKALVGNIAQLEAGRQITTAQADGFESLKALLPPPSRRGLILIDPSYEIKSDYLKVSDHFQDCLYRFPTGTFIIWYPIIPRPEAHELPRRLKTIARKAGKPFLNTSLAIGIAEKKNTGEAPKRPGLTASGLFIVNPPHTLKAALDIAGPELLTTLGRGKNAAFVAETA